MQGGGWSGQPQQGYGVNQQGYGVAGGAQQGQYGYAQAGQQQAGPGAYGQAAYGQQQQAGASAPGAQGYQAPQQVGGKVGGAYVQYCSGAGQGQQPQGQGGYQAPASSQPAGYGGYGQAAQQPSAGAYSHDGAAAAGGARQAQQQAKPTPTAYTGQQGAGYGTSQAGTPPYVGAYGTGAQPQAAQQPPQQQQQARCGAQTQQTAYGGAQAAQPQAGYGAYGAQAAQTQAAYNAPAPQQQSAYGAQASAGAAAQQAYAATGQQPGVQAAQQVGYAAPRAAPAAYGQQQVPTTAYGQHAAAGYGAGSAQPLQAGAAGAYGAPQAAGATAYGTQQAAGAAPYGAAGTAQPTAYGASQPAQQAQAAGYAGYGTQGTTAAPAYAQHQAAPATASSYGTTQQPGAHGQQGGAAAAYSRPAAAGYTGYGPPSSPTGAAGTYGSSAAGARHGAYISNTTGAKPAYAPNPLGLTLPYTGPGGPRAGGGASYSSPRAAAGSARPSAYSGPATRKAPERTEGFVRAGAMRSGFPLPPPPPGGVLRGRVPGPAEREARGAAPAPRRRSPSPLRPPSCKRSASPPRPSYGVHLAGHIFSTPALDYREAERRYSELFMAPDFVKAVQCWVDLPTGVEGSLGCRLGGLDRPVPMEHLISPTKQVTSYEIETKHRAPSGTTIYSAKVLLLSGLSEVDRTAVLEGGHAKEGEHIGRLLKFVVVRSERGGEKSGIFCLGGRCAPELDGDPTHPDPAAARAALVAAATRHARAQAQLDLTRCSEWVRFLEVHYQRLDRNDVEHHREVAVLFLLTDSERCLPTEAEWPAAWEAQKAVKLAKALADRTAKAAELDKAKQEALKKVEAATAAGSAGSPEPMDADGGSAATNGKAAAAGEAGPAQEAGEKEPQVPEPPMPERPQLQLVGLHTESVRLKTMPISLDGLRDYNTNDREEGTFELSLFAEAFHDMLQHDYGQLVLAELVRQRDAALARREERKRKREAEEAEAAAAKGEGGEGAQPEKKARGEDGGAQPAPAGKAAAEADAAAPAAAGEDEGQEKEAPTKEAAPRNELLLLAFRYFDKTGAGYFRVDDMRRLLDNLGVGLHHSVVKDLALTVSDPSGRYKNERIHYAQLCETETRAEPAAEAKPAPQHPVAKSVPQEAEAATVKDEAATGLEAQAEPPPVVAEDNNTGAGEAQPADGEAAVPEPVKQEAAAEEAGDGEATAPARAGDDGAASDNQLAVEVAALDVPGLAAKGKLASLTVANLSKYCTLHGLPTSGKKADIVARVQEHASAASAGGA